MCEFIDEKSEQEDVDYVTSIDIYNNSIDTEAQEALKKVDAMRKMIGIVPPLGSEVLCSSEQETENYNRINFKMVGKISALESMLSSAKKELAEANETIAKLKTALSRYECRVKGE